MEESNTIGTLLRAQRETQNISIQEVAQKTKININILKSLENDDLKNLPNKTYVKGFVRNYAKTIGLDVNDASNALENTYHIKYGETAESETAPVQKQLGALQADTPEETETEEIKETLLSIAQGFMNKKIIYGLGALFVVFIIGKGVVNFFSQLNVESKKFQKEKVVLKEETEDLFNSDTTKKIREEEAIQSSQEEINTETEKSKNIIAKTEEVTPESKVTSVIAQRTKENEEKEEEKKTEKDEVPAGRYPYKNFYQAPSELYDLIADAPEVSDETYLPSSIKNRHQDGKQSLYLIAEEGDTWISYQVDDQDIKRYVLKEGKRLFLQGDVILLFMGNLNATKIFLNNQLVQAETKTGVKSLIFPETVASNYELPLFPSYNGVPHTAKEYKERMMEKESSN